MAKKLQEVVWEKITHMSSETIGWIAVMIIQSATIPTFVAVMQGVTDRLPQIDIMLTVWLGLALFFIKAVISKDFLNIITIGLGFFAQLILLAMIFVK